MGQAQIKAIDTVEIQPHVFVARPYSFQPKTLDELLNAKADQIAECDVARMNLLCATGLPGAENLDIEKCLRRLDFIAEHVRKDTARDLPRYRANPKWIYKNEKPQSDNAFRMAHLATAMQGHYKMHYDSRLIRDPKRRAKWDWRTAFADSRAILIHGLLGEKRAGIYTPLSIVGVAIGRRLGYPVFLTGTPHYDFVRWNAPDDWFNAEILDGGCHIVHENEGYRKWPEPMHPVEEQSGYYLRNFTPADELALCLSCRAQVLMCNLRFEESVEVWANCCLLAPTNPEYPRIAKNAVVEAMFLKKHRRLMEWTGKRWLRPVEVVDEDPRKMFSPRLAALAISVSAHGEETTGNQGLALRRFQIAMETDVENLDHKINLDRCRTQLHQQLIAGHVRTYETIRSQAPHVKLPPLEKSVEQFKVSLSRQSSADEPPPDNDHMHQLLLNARRVQSLSHQARGIQLMEAGRWRAAQIAFAQAFFGGDKKSQHDFVANLRAALTKEIEQIKSPNAMWPEDEDVNPRDNPFFQVSDEQIAFIWHNRGRVLEGLARYAEASNAYAQAAKLSARDEYVKDNERLSALLADRDPKATEKAKAAFHERFELSELERNQRAAETCGIKGLEQAREGKWDRAQAAFAQAH